MRAGETMGRNTVRGQIVSDKDHHHLIGFRVEAWAEDYVKGRLGAAASDASDHFKIVIDKRFAEVLEAQSPDVSFKVFMGKMKAHNAMGYRGPSGTAVDGYRAWQSAA